MLNSSVEGFEETEDCIILADDDTQCKCFNGPEPFFDDSITQNLRYMRHSIYKVYTYEDLGFKPPKGIIPGSYSSVQVCFLKKKLKHDALPEVVGYLLEEENIERNAPSEVVEHLQGNIAAILFKHCGDSLLNYILEKDAPVSDDNPLGYHNENRFIEWADQLAKVIQHMHDAKIPHRDISPHNILIQVNNVLPHRSKLILTDLGSARFMNTEMTRDHGRPGYMAPEEFYQSGQSTEYCCKVDTYSFGMVWYFAITKTEPFENLRDTFRHKGTGLGIFLHKTDWNADEIAAYENDVSIFPGKHPRPLFGKECGYTKMQKIVKKCWEHDPNKRPTMNGIQKMISKLRATEDG